MQNAQRKVSRRSAPCYSAPALRQLRTLAGASRLSDLAVLGGGEIAVSAATAGSDAALRAKRIQVAAAAFSAAAAAAGMAWDRSAALAITAGRAVAVSGSTEEQAAAFFASPATAAAAACAQALLRAMWAPDSDESGAPDRPAGGSPWPRECCSRTCAWVLPAPAEEDDGAGGGPGPPPQRELVLACALVLAYGAAGGLGGGAGDRRPQKRRKLGESSWEEGWAALSQGWWSDSDDDDDDDRRRGGSGADGGVAPSPAPCPCCCGRAASGGGRQSCTARDGGGGLCPGAVGSLLAWAARPADQSADPQPSEEAAPAPLTAIRAPCCSHFLGGLPPARSPLLEVPPPLAAAAAAAHGGLLRGYVETLLRGRPWGRSPGGGGSAPQGPAQVAAREDEPREAAARVRHLLVRIQPPSSGAHNFS